MRSSGRRPREVRVPDADLRRPGADLRVPLDVGGPLGWSLQVPPELLAVRARRGASLRARSWLGPRRLAAAPLQPVEPRRRGLRREPEAVPVIAAILASPLTPLEDIL